MEQLNAHKVIKKSTIRLVVYLKSINDRGKHMPIMLGHLGEQQKAIM